LKMTARFPQVLCRAIDQNVKYQNEKQDKEKREENVTEHGKPVQGG
jgi:hypothetical protein